MKDVIVYGAYGYTGELIVAELQTLGIKPTIAGRSMEKTKTMAESLNLDFLCFDLDDNHELEQTLEPFILVIHCAGPFIHTAKAMAEACIASNTHYIDITGEFQVFENLKEMSKKAEQAGVMLLPGAGFDVVPSDCLAAQLSEDMPDAENLTLAFTGLGGGLSRGTTKTMIENADKGQVYRNEGVLKTRSSGASTAEIDFGEFKQVALGISWGDISSAYHSTGIPNIEVFIGSTNKQIKQARMMDKFSLLLKPNFVKSYLKNKVNKKPAGPSTERREKSKMYLWGQVKNKLGEVKEARLITPNGYTLTAITAGLITVKILNNQVQPGFQTPSTAYGKDLILEVEGVSVS